MTKKDFVYAWVLAHRAANPMTLFTDLCNRQLLTQAEQVYDSVEREFKDEVQPFKREWVGLTDNERMDLYLQFTDSDEWTYEKAIEAKLKEKNT